MLSWHNKAPEVFEGDYDGRVDLYSAGVILFEMLFMRTPHPCATLDELLPILARKEPIIIPDLISAGAIRTSILLCFSYSVIELPVEYLHV